MLVVSNPVDVLTYLAVTQLDLPAGQVIGLGTQLDTARFRSLIAEALELPPTQVSGLILGEHGDSMVPIWSAAQAGGLPLERFPGWNAGARRVDHQAHPRQRCRGDQAQGGRGVRGRASRSAKSSTRSPSDQKRILPVSSLVNGPYGLRDVCISVPTVVGRKGVLEPARDRALAQGDVGASAFGPGPA